MITKVERTELRSLIRQRFRVLRADVDVRGVEMAAEMEHRLAAHCEAEEKLWTDVAFLLHEITLEANRKANDAVREVIGRESWPQEYELISAPRLAGIRQVAKAPPDRAHLRRQGSMQIEATIRAAQLELDRQEADLLTELATTALESQQAREFLGRIPTVSALVPTSRLAELEASLWPDGAPSAIEDAT